MAKSVEVKVSAQAWECPCGLAMGVPEKPVCDCGDYRLDGRAAVEVKPEKPAQPAGLQPSDPPVVAAK